MFDTTESVIEFLSAIDDFEFAGSYGEPGYSTEGTTPLIVLGNYWCRCRKVGFDSVRGHGELHDYGFHYPKVFAKLTSQGVQFEWSDEWMVDYPNDKAYRTSADSYSWQPSVMFTDDGDPLTPGNDIEDWIEYVANEPTRALPSKVWSSDDLEAAGFTRYLGEFESGWHPGQDADPSSISDDIREISPDDVDIVFLIDDTGQFDIRFSAWIRVV